MAKRVGPKMLAAVEYVRRNPGCAILPVAEYIGPHGSRQFGYAAVHRAIDAGLIVARPGTRRGTYALFPIGS